MVRSVDNDFSLLSGFVEKYSLAALVAKGQYSACLKQGHRDYFVLLSLWAEIEFRLSAGGISVNGITLQRESRQAELLKEAVSDFGSALFCCVHGIYKPGHMALRSSIENFVRSLSGIHSPKALGTSSIHELFDIAKGLPAFSDERAALLANLRGIYTHLCKFSHSASLAHMAHIGSLQHFPAFDESAFRDWERYAKDVVRCEVSCILHLNPKLYHNSHYKLKDVLNIGLFDPTIRTQILGGV